MKLKCPLCMGVSFASEETLLHSLLSFSSINIACPLCIEVSRGFDKFTIHLCSHVFNLQSNGTVTLIEDTSTNVVGLNEILENIHIDEQTKLPESNLLRMQTELGINADSISDPRVSIFSNSELTNTNGSEKLMEGLTAFHPIINTIASREDHANESKNWELQKPSEQPLALQVSLNNNIQTGFASSPFFEVAEPAVLPLVDDMFQNLEFLFNVDKSTTDFNQPVEDLCDDLKKSQSQTFASTPTPTDFFVEENSDPGGRNVNTQPSSSLRANTCEICSISFPDINILSLHKELVHEKIDKGQLPKPKFQCEICKRKFKLKASLQAHQRVAHAVENGLGLLDANQNEESSQFQCNVCSKIFKKENYLIQHMKTHEEKQWTCDECGKIFATKHFLQNHKRLHTGEMPYICSICNKQFTFQQSYHRHIAYHNSEKPHRCKECGKSFKELSTLYNHQRIHTGEKPFSCDVCGKSFRQRVTCLMHSRIHTNSKEFKCSKCQKSFRYKISLRSHKCVHSTIPALGLTDTSSMQQ